MESKKDKILFWLENYSIHFGISKILTEKYDCDAYALIASSPKQKDFFENQKLVQFKKKWFVRDHVKLKGHKPDFEKLKSYQKKIHIPIKQIIYADRLFYKFNNYHSFSDDEIFSIIEQELKLYYQILDEIKPDFVIMRAPEFQDIDLFCEVCKAKNIKVLLLSPVRMGDRFRITSEPDSPIQFDKMNDNLDIKDFKTLKKHVEDFSKVHKTFLKNAQPKTYQKFNTLKLLFSTYSSENINSYRDVGKTPWSTLKHGLSSSISSHSRKLFLDKHAQTLLKLDQPYAYFPLHMEPERSILRKAQFFTDQINVIKNIAQSLPVEMDLLVKEHPSMQLIGWRDTKFYKNISSLPKVKLIHPSVPSLPIIQNSSLIISIAGTTALEAAFFQKPSIIFSDIDCSSLSCISKVNNLEHLPELIKESISSKVDLIELNQFVNAVIESSFLCNVMDLQVQAANLFGIGGFLTGNEISESQMGGFIEKYQDSFEILAEEHIKQIKLIKNNDLSSN